MLVLYLLSFKASSAFHTSVFLSCIKLSHLLLAGKSRFMTYVGTFPLNLKDKYQSSNLKKALKKHLTK